MLTTGELYKAGQSGRRFLLIDVLDTPHAGLPSARRYPGVGLATPPADLASLLAAELGDPGASVALRGSSMGGYLAIRAAAQAGAAAVVAICPASASGLRRGLHDGSLDFAADVPALTRLLAEDGALAPYVEALAAFRRTCAHRRAVPIRDVFDSLLAAFGRHFDALKAAQGSLDFEDLELRAADLVARDAAVRAGLRERYERVMVDELQDTNAVQMGLIEAIGDGRLFTLRRKLTFALRGSATWQSADSNRIILTDVKPEGQHVVLSLHYQEGLRVAPSRIKIERQTDPRDAIPFVRLCLDDQAPAVPGNDPARRCPQPSHPQR